MSRRAEIVEYLLDQIDTALILKAETLIKLLQKYFGVIKLRGEISREICRCTSYIRKLQSRNISRYIISTGLHPKKYFIKSIELLY